MLINWSLNRSLADCLFSHCPNNVQCRDQAGRWFCYDEETVCHCRRKCDIAASMKDRTELLSRRRRNCQAIITLPLANDPPGAISHAPPPSPPRLYPSNQQALRYAVL